MTPNEKVELLICIVELCSFVLILCLGDVIIRVIENHERAKRRKMRKKRAARTGTSDCSIIRYSVTK